MHPAASIGCVPCICQCLLAAFSYFPQDPWVLFPPSPHVLETPFPLPLNFPHHSFFTTTIPLICVFQSLYLTGTACVPVLCFPL